MSLHTHTQHYIIYTNICCIYKVYIYTYTYIDQSPYFSNCSCNVTIWSYCRNPRLWHWHFRRLSGQKMHQATIFLGQKVATSPCSEENEFVYLFFFHKINPFYAFYLNKLRETILRPQMLAGQDEIHLYKQNLVWRQHPEETEALKVRRKFG